MDYENGNDANDGSSWALAWKTITSGATAARIAPADTIRIAKSPAPTSLGNGIWETVPNTLPESKSIVSTTNASPISVQVTSHGYSTGDRIYIQNHATNLTANGTWTITYVDANNFTLDGSTGVDTGVATGSTTKINSHTVVLETADTKNITMCEQAWTASGSSTVTLDTTLYKSGDASAKIVKTSPANSTLYAYFAIGGGAGVDYSGYQKVSFWIYNATAITANQWDLCLCSDTAGATVVDTIAIPAIPSVSRWVCLTIARNSGGNLGNSIQSVALYSGSSAGTTAGIYLDNILACTTSGLNLQSLISKNTTENAGTECWFALQSISEDGKVLRIDNQTNTIANTGITTRGYGYVGTSETVTTYKRETIKTSMVSGASTIVQEIQDSGTAGNLINFEGGYNTATSLQDGDTYFDGLNGFGIGLRFTSKSYVQTNYINVIRYGIGYSTNSCSFLTFTTINNLISNTSYNFSTSTTNDCTLTTLLNSNNGAIGFDISGARWTIGTITSRSNSSGNIVLAGQSHVITTINSSNNKVACLAMNSSMLNNITTVNIGITGDIGITLGTCYSNVIENINILRTVGAGLFISSSRNNIIGTVDISYGSNYGITFTSANKNIISSATITNNSSSAVNSSASQENEILTLTSSGNSSGVSINVGSLYLRNASIAEATEVSGYTSYADTKVYSNKHDQTADNHWVFMEGGSINSQATTRHTASGIAWKYTTTSSTRNSVYPIYGKLAQVAVSANTLVTIKCWVKKDHATNVVGKLFLRGNQIAGVASDVTATKANDTDWEELTITFTPTEAGVVEVEGLVYYSAGNSSVYFDDLSVTQA